MSKYTVIKETVGNFHQTTAVRRSDLKGLAEVMAFIEYHLIAPEPWDWRLRDGSITYQNRKETHRVIKIFVDYHRKLLNKMNSITNFVGPPDPIVIGVELTYEDPYTRHLLREGLKNEYPFYGDPRVGGNSKYFLQPVPPDKRDQHIYDVLFLGTGRCENIPENLIEKTLLKLEEEYKHPTGKAFPVGNDLVQALD